MAGILRVASPSATQQAARQAAQPQVQPAQVLSRLAQHVMSKWEEAKRAKTLGGGVAVAPETRMRMALRQRQGIYEADKLSAIKEHGGSELFIMLTSVKCRAAASWLRDAITGQGTEKPWTVSPTPIAELPDDYDEELQRAVGEEVGQMIAAGVVPPTDLVLKRLDAARDAAADKVRELARQQAKSTERALEDALLEGGFMAALDAAIDDLVTYPAAFIKGPVPMMQPRLKWVRGEDGRKQAQVVYEIVKTYHRVSPFNIYPMPWMTCIDDGDLFELHELQPAMLYAMIGAPGYNEQAIRAVLDECQNGKAYTDWAGVGRVTDREMNQPGAQYATGRPIQALELWGQVPGSHLAEWGVPVDQVPDPQRLYDVNVWQIGGHTIKAVINSDPLGAKPYSKASYEEVPGAFWGNAVPDLMRDLQELCNAAGRSLVNNMAMASGPMMWVNVNRLPPGEKLTRPTPWRTIQGTDDAMGSTAPPVYFFQPKSNASELMAVFQHFSQLADEVTGIPKYLAGDGRVGGAGRTSSGLSMLMGNATKLMKQVLGGVDAVFEEVLTRTHRHMLRFEMRPELEGDIRIVARGVNSVSARETMQLRRNEFLFATNNPIDAQIMGQAGRAALLREQASTLGMNVDEIIPAQPAPTAAPPGGMPGMSGMSGMSGTPGMPGLGGLPGTPGSPPVEQSPGALMNPIGA